MLARVRPPVTLVRMATRPERLPNAIMDAAPVNEMGVVCLFTDWARKHGVRIESIQSAFPDCIAWMKAGGREQRVRIEFEFKSRNFRTHRHAASQCDWIVCWEHDWADCPARLHVLELRREYGLGFNVWIQPVSDRTKERYSSQIAKVEDSCNWTVASQAHEGDLVLFYHSKSSTGPRCEISDVFRVSGPVEVRRAGKRGFAWNARDREWCADLTRVARLTSPVTLAHLKSHRALKDAGWIRNNLVSRARVTVDWVFVRELIVERNSGVEKRLPRVTG